MARYTPGIVPSNPAEQAEFLRQELQKIAQAIESPVEQIDLRPLAAEPKKYRDGTIVHADGSNWDPGAGAGAYCRYGAVWHFLG